MKKDKITIIFTKTKRYFLLIEIVIALAIISLLSFPLLRNPTYFCISQLKSLEKLECERIAELTFLDIKLAILKKEINLKNIPYYEKEAEIIQLSSYYLETFKNKEVKRFYKIYSKRKKTTLDDQTIKLVNVEICLEPKGLTYQYLYRYKIIIKT